MLEALVALALVAIAGVTLLSLASSCIERVRTAVRADAESRDASAFLDAVALWTRDDLTQRLGRRPQGPFLLVIARPEPMRFTVALLDSLGEHAFARTQLFRPAPSHDLQ